jgi:hypothetical protein
LGEIKAEIHGFEDGSFHLGSAYTVIQISLATEGTILKSIVIDGTDFRIGNFIPIGIRNLIIRENAIRAVSTNGIFRVRCPTIVPGKARMVPFS